MLLFDQVKEDLQEKIRRLEEDRHNIDITSGKMAEKNPEQNTDSHFGIFHTVHLRQRRGIAAVTERCPPPHTHTHINRLHELHF